MMLNPQQTASYLNAGLMAAGGGAAGAGFTQAGAAAAAAAAAAAGARTLLPHPVNTTMEVGDVLKTEKRNV